jgi:hypothetical protein
LITISSGFRLPHAALLLQVAQEVRYVSIQEGLGRVYGRHKAR